MSTAKSAQMMGEVADLLRSWGRTVHEEPGWQTRGRGEMAEVLGVIDHHTATGGTTPYPTRKILREGRSDLPGPLCNFGLERGPNPAIWLVAAGKANHAGTGGWPGVTRGSRELWGVEAENNGTGEPWHSYDAYVDLNAAITIVLARHGRKAIVIGHKEYATPKGRKIDPYGIDMDRMRADVARRVTAATGGTAMPSNDAEAKAARYDQITPWLGEAHKVLVDSGRFKSDDSWDKLAGVLRTLIADSNTLATVVAERDQARADLAAVQSGGPKATALRTALIDFLG